MTLEPCQVLDMESPRLPLQFLSRKILLICAWEVVEHIEQRLDIQLRKDPRRIEHRIRCLWVVRRCLDRITRHVVLRLLCILRLWHAGVATLEQLVHLVKVRHAVWRFLFHILKGHYQVRQ